MNYNIDTALCIGGPCLKKDHCARHIVYSALAAAEQRGELSSNPNTIITAPPFSYNDGCFFYLPSALENANDTAGEPTTSGD